MLYNLEKRNGKSYLVISSIDYLEPRWIEYYYPIGLDPIFITGEDVRIERYLSAYLFRLGDRQYSFNIISDGELPEFTEFKDIKPPKKTGYIWKWGEWVKK